MKKKLKKVWGKINLLETSAVGIPVYPYAHKSFSLIKALTETEEPALTETEEPHQPKLEGKKSMGETEESKDNSADESNADEDSKDESDEDSKDESDEDSKDESEETTKGIKGLTGMIAKAFSDGMKEAIEVSKTERGLVSPEADLKKQIKEKLESKSIGELAVMSGLFREPAIIGATKGAEEW